MIVVWRCRPISSSMIILAAVGVNTDFCAGQLIASLTRVHGLLLCGVGRRGRVSWTRRRSSDVGHPHSPRICHLTYSLVRPDRFRYRFPVHWATVLIHASFRPRLGTAALRFANPSPPSGWIKDFHLQGSARKKKGAHICAPLGKQRNKVIRFLG
jgi:hypothetical protein